MESTKGKARKKARQAVSLIAAACLALALVPAASFAADGDDADPYDLSTATISGIEESYDCTGAQITPAITVTDSAGVELIADQDYTVEYGENVAPGDGAGSVTIEGTSTEGAEPAGYYGTKEATFTINDNVVFTVYEAEEFNDTLVKGSETVVNEYCYDDLVDFAENDEHESILANFYNTNVQATDQYVTFDEIIADAYENGESGLEDPWTDATEEEAATVSATIEAASDGRTWNNTVSKADLESTYGYWYGDAVINEDGNIYSETQEATQVPASIGLGYGSVALADYSGDEQNADTAAAAALEDGEFHLRGFIGSSIDETTGIVSAPRGNMMLTDLGALYVCTEAEEYDLEDAVVTGIDEDGYDCTGAAIKPAITVTDPAGIELIEGQDYVVGYADNVAPTSEDNQPMVIISEVTDEQGQPASQYTGNKNVEFDIHDNTVITVYDAQAVDGNIVKANETFEYKYGQLKALIEEDEEVLSNNFSTTRVQTTTGYVTFDDLIAYAYTANGTYEDRWTAAKTEEEMENVSVSVSATDGTDWASTITKGDLEGYDEGTQKYYGQYANFYGDITATKTTPEGDPVAAPPAIALTYGSGNLTDQTEEEKQTAAGLAGALENEQSYELRTFIGSSVDGTTGEIKTPTGKFMLSGVNKIYVCEEINSHDLANATIAGIDEEAYDCTGAAITPTITVKDAAGVDLIEDQDYTVACENNVEPGTATLTVTGTGEYSGTLTAEYTINDTPVLTVYDADISKGYVDEWTTQTVKEYKYDELKTLAEENSDTLATFYGTNVQATDEYITFDQIAAEAYDSEENPWSNPSESDLTKVSANIVGTDGFTWSAAQTKEALTTTYGYWYGDAVYQDGSIVVPDTGSKEGTAVSPSIGLEYVGVALSDYDDANAAAAAAKEAAEPTLRGYIGSSINSETGVVSAPRGNMMVSNICSLYVYTEVSEFDLANADVEGIDASYDCTGAAITPAITVKDAAGVDLIEGQDYEVTYSNNVAPGTATVTVSGLGEYAGTSQIVEFTIEDSVVLTVNQYNSDNGAMEGDPTKVAEYKYGDLTTLAGEASHGTLATFYNTNVQATDSYITFDELIADAYTNTTSGLTDPWTNATDETAVEANIIGTDGFKWGSAQSKEALATTYGYWYGDAVYSDGSIVVTDETAREGTKVPASIGLEYEGVALSEYDNATKAAAAAKEAAQPHLRGYIGASINEETGVVSAPRGNMMVTDVCELAVCVEEPATEDDYAELQACIDEATTTLNSATVSEDGTDVTSDKKWVTQDVADALSAAITTATETVGTTGLLARDIEDAISALSKAVSTFVAAEEDGLAASSEEYATLEAEITSAQTTLGSVTVSTNGSDVDPGDKWVTQDAYDALQAAIATAQAAYEVTGASSADIEAAISALSTALSTFEAAEQSGLKPSSDETKALADEITSAQSALNSVKVSANGSDVASNAKWVTQDVYDALKAAIDAAQATYAKSDATSTEIEAARAALSEALATFTAAQKSGTKASGTTKAKNKKQTIKCKTKVKLKKGGKKLKIKVKGVKTTLCWKANKKAQKALKIKTGTKTLTLKALKKAKKGKTYKIKLWAGVGNNYAKSKVKTIKVKIK